MASGLAGAAVIALFELVALLGGSGFASASWVTLGLFAGLGLVVALALTLSELLARWARGPWTRALARSLPAVLVLIPVGGALFEGAFASTLPGASLGRFWVPLFGLALLASALLGADRLLERPRARTGLAVGLVASALLFDLLNRHLLPSEYAELHTALLVACVVMAGLGLRLVVDRFHPRQWSWPRGRPGRRLQVTAAIAASMLVASATAGLRDRAGRRAIADDGMHGRLLVRAVKALADWDGDGHVHLFGGGECNELDAAINPDAHEVVGNGVDEDCDGLDQDRPWILPGDATRRERLARWRRGEEVEAFARGASRLNVVMVVVDALRADPFVPTPENLAAFPNLFALRAQSRWFSRAFSPAAGTDLSMTGVLTGKPNPMAGAAFTMPEVFTAAGYRTHAVIPAEVLRFVSPTMLTRGFASHVVVSDAGSAGPVGITAPRTTDLGLGFLDRWGASPERPFFLWVHYFDVHEHAQIRPEATGGASPPRTPRDRYRALLRVVDASLGRLLGDLDRRGLRDNTIVMLLSDHGESLGEHPRLPERHGRVLYNALTHVPLAVRMPGIAPADIPHPVSLLDLPVTLFDLLGAPVASAEVQGESLLPLLLDAPPSLFQPPRILPLHESDQFGIVAWPHKLLVSRTTNLVELYDLSRDFAEAVDRAEDEPALVRSLLQAYRSFPSVPLDRTKAGRRRWDAKAKATRPSRETLVALAARVVPDPGVPTWRPSPAARQPDAARPSPLAAVIPRVTARAGTKARAAKAAPRTSRARAPARARTPPPAASPGKRQRGPSSRDKAAVKPRTTPAQEAPRTPAGKRAPAPRKTAAAGSPARPTKSARSRSAKAAPAKKTSAKPPPS